MNDSTQFFTWKLVTAEGTFWATVQGHDAPSASQTLDGVLAKIGLVAIGKTLMKRGGPPERAILVYWHQGELNCNAGREIWAALGRLAEWEKAKP